MATLQEMKDLAVYSAKGKAPTNYSVENVDEALCDGFREMAGSYYQFMQNRYDIYEIITIAIDEVVPKKVIDAMGIFADVQVVGEGQKAIFKRPIGKLRARKFLTRAATNGVYETFRVDNETIEIPTHTVGGGVTVDFQRVRDGAEKLSDLMDLMATGLTDAVYLEVQAALRASLNALGRPAANKVVGTSFNADLMVKLITVVKSYGSDAVIFAPLEFIAAMGADAIVPVGANYRGIYHPQDIDAIHNTGYINLFRGTPVIQIPQSYTDKTNKKTWIDPQMAYVLPTGRDRVVKVVLEGSSLVRDDKNRDGSMEIMFERKIGAGVITHYNWGIYQNTSIPQTYESPYGM